MQLRASQFPKLKQWSEWEMEFPLSMAERFGRGAEIEARAGAGGGRGLRKSCSQGLS